MSITPSYKRKIETKASEEHLQLSSFIKEVHKKLRHDSKERGWEETWREHINNQEMLSQYATTMENLACKHWKENQDKENSKALSRISWVHDKCQEYFNSNLFRSRQQELEIAEKCELSSGAPNLEVIGNLKLLDVGSCYNPFKKYNYDVVAIDIAPSNSDVQQCDFLNITFEPINNLNENITQIECYDEANTCTSEKKSIRFRRESFHIVVFSLLLDYFPSPELRLKCCQNAYDLLKFEGILVIISPDAKHVGANAKYMKSWRLVLAKMGFRRIVYEKLPYIHCMVFRKCNNADVAKRWATLHENEKFFDKLYVPQDFTSDNMQ